MATAPPLRLFTRCLGYRTLCACALTLSTAALPAHADDQVTPAATRIRSATPAVLQLLVEGASRSATFAAHLERFERTGWLVFIDRGRCPDRRVDACLLPIVGRFEGRRWLRILLNEWNLRHRDDEIGAMAHELQHAIEAAEAPDVVDAASLSALFRRIGYMSLQSSRVTVYETEAARQVGYQVLRELRRAGRPRSKGAR